MDHLSMTIGQLQTQSSPSKTVGREYAARAAKTIFSRYPNPKAGPEYLVELANCLAEQPQWIVDRLTDRHLGITAKHKSFAPGIGEVLDLIAGLREMQDRYARYSEIQGRRTTNAAQVLQPFRPYPRLWQAFVDEPAVIEALDNPGTFDFLTEASKRFAIRGKDAARDFILPPKPIEEAA